MVCSFSSSVNYISIASSSTLHKFRLDQSSTCARFTLDPSKSEKKRYRMSSFSSCDQRMPSISVLRYAIRFLLRSPFAHWWKYFVHSSPSLMLINLEHWRHRDLSIAAHPRICCFKFFHEIQLWCQQDPRLLGNAEPKDHLVCQKQL